MEKDYRERRKRGPTEGRRTFGELAKAALHLRLRDARGQSVRWTVAPNKAWVSWLREDGRHAYASLRRQSDFITGELGASLVALELDDLPQVETVTDTPAEGCRIALGTLLHGHSKTWSSGGSEEALIQRLDWLAQQLHLRLYAFMASTAPPAK